MPDYLILHGHFYQPPREIPSTGLIPCQTSAYPYHDWNARIAKECYGANSYSRVLNKKGRITDIVNNYRYISFNIGPTLLDWLEKFTPGVYGRIIEADKESAKSNSGHGNAIAQGYNHTILPLDTPEDAEIQIYWGIRNFQHHFGRYPEGFWLPEAAVNIRIIDILIEYGIKFIILSPNQAQSIRKIGEKNWHKIQGNRDISGRPYIIKGEKGSLSVFFYSKFLSEGISFNHFLRNADTFYQTLLEIRKKNPGALIHTATDGEIYGHHEPFGDMCLAALTKKIKHDGILEFTNYGMYLEKTPPEYEAELKTGEDGKGTSWSCFHGVSRWYRDCGCSTGGEEGWNQKWRTPFRDSFEYLSRKTTETFKRTAAAVSDLSPFDILKNYEKVLNRETKPLDYARHVLRDYSKEEAETLLKLLEGQVNRLFMFTSCGWFFSDISGIEPVQNMRYAGETLKIYSNLLPDDTEHRFFEILSTAVSNLPDKKTGTDIFREEVSRYPEGFEAALYFCGRKDAEEYGFFKLVKLEESGDLHHAEVLNTKTTGILSFDFTLPRHTENRIFIELKSHMTVYRKLGNIDPEIKEGLLKLAESDIDKYTPAELVFIFNYCGFLDLPVPSTINGNTVKLISKLLRKNLERKESVIPQSVFSDICDLINLSNTYGLEFDRTIPQNILMDNLKTIRAEKIKDGTFYSQTVTLCSLMGICTENEDY